MPRIKKIIFSDFKYFYGKTELNLERKNLLLYGENGSGKSTIYWGLYTFLQSVYKDDLEVKKYFNVGDPENLVNRFSFDNNDSKIEITFEKENKSSFNRLISNTTVNTKDGSEIAECAQASDFLNYRLLSRLYDFRNSEDINFFPSLEIDTLMFINFRETFIKRDGKEGGRNANDWWIYIKAGLNPHPKKMKSKDFTDFTDIIVKFNTELKFALTKTVEETNKFLQEYFKLPISIKYEYKECIYHDFWPGTNSRNKRTTPPQILITATDKGLPENANKLSKPHTFLNEAKLSAIALSMRLAILREKYLTSASKILVIDDLLLSLDMSNRSTVLDIIFKELNDYQIIFMTHDKALYEITKHKISQYKDQSWLKYEMYSSIKDNIPQPLIISSNTHIQKAHKYLQLKEFDVSGNFQRKACEEFCKDLLPIHLQRSKDMEPYDLSGLLDKCTTYTSEININNEILSGLSFYRKYVLNPSSHHCNDVPKFQDEVEKCLVKVNELLETKKEIIVKKNTKLSFELSDATDTYLFDILIHDDLKLIQFKNQVSTLSKGRFSYKMLKNGSDFKSDSKDNLQQLYSKIYQTSNKTKSSNYWDEIVLTESQAKIKTLRHY